MPNVCRGFTLMKKLLFFLSFFVLVLSLAVSPKMAFAQSDGCAVNEIQTDFGCWPNDPDGFVQAFYNVGLAFVAGIAILAIIVGGYTIMTSQGNPEKLNVGKSWIFYAIVGLLLAVFGYVFIQVVVVDVLRVPGFS